MPKKYLPRITAVSAGERPNTLHIVWERDGDSLVDISGLIETFRAYAPLRQSAELFRQVLWSIEEGALRRFDTRLALNIALKKIRDGAWTKPNRLPPNWLASARAETCSAA